MSTQNGCQSERVIQSCALQSSVYPQCKSIRENINGGLVSVLFNQNTGRLVD